MRIWCFDDRQSGWGKLLFVAARCRGYDARLFKKPHEVDKPGFLFYRIEQASVNKQRRDALICLDVQGVIGIQKREGFLEYENKLYQLKKYPLWMPESYFINEEINAKQKAIDLGFPVVSKSRAGSGSSGVRLLADMDAVLAEAKIVFGRGLHTFREVQQGYLLYQKFLPGNDFIYRVVRIGEWYWMLRVFNRADIPLASGSGRFEPVLPDTSVKMTVLDTAVKFFNAADTKWCGIDLIYDRGAADWKVIETTLAWNFCSPGANIDCLFFDKDGVLPTAGWTGVHQFEVLLDELERGVFDG